MAVNRYDSPAQDRYFNTYVPLPYEQIMPVIAARQAQLEREQEMLNKTFEDTKNIKYIPGTKDEAYVRDYLGNVSGLVDKYYGADLSDPVVKQQMRSAFSKMTNKQNIQNIQSSYDAWATNQKYKAELKAKGLYDPSIDEDPATLGQWDTVGSGKVYDYIAPAYKNPQPVADEYFKPLKPSDLGPIGDYMYSGVDEKRIDEVVDAQWSNFANTSEGNQYVRKMAKQSGQDPNDPDVRETIAKEYLRDRGYSAFTYTDRGNMTPEAQIRLAKGKKDEEEPTLPSTPLRNLYGAEVDQFRNVKKLDAAIDKFLSSDKPSDQAKGYDLQVNKESAMNIPPKVLEERENIVTSMKDELMNTGKFSSDENLESFQTIIDGYMEYRNNIGKLAENTKTKTLDKLSYKDLKNVELLAKAVDANKINNLIKDSPIVITNMLKSIGNAPELISATLTKISNPLKYKDYTIKELADSYGTKSAKLDYTEKNNMYDVISKYTSTLNSFDDRVSKEVNENILNKTSSINSKSYSYGFPYYESSSLSQTVNPSTGEKLGVFDLAYISNDLLSSSSNYQIISIDDKSIEDIKDKKVENIKTRINTKDLEDIKIDVLPDSKYNYAPVIELTYNAQNQNVNERHKVRTVLNDPTQRFALAKTLANRGDYEAATVVSQPQIAKEISENKFEVGENYKYKLNTSDSSYSIAIRRDPDNPSSFELLYPDSNKEGEISITKADNRQTLLGLLYKLVTINNATFTLE